MEDAADAADIVKLHPATTKEVQALCADLQVLGRSEFKALLKWCAPQCPRMWGTLLVEGGDYGAPGWIPAASGKAGALWGIAPEHL